MSTRKVTRQEMKHDEFVSAVGRITLWLEDHAQILLWALAGVLAAGGTGYGAWAYLDYRAIQSESSLSAVVEAYGAPVDLPADRAGAVAVSFATDEEKYRAVIDRADETLRDYGSTRAGRVALYYRGLAFLELGEVETAGEVLGEFRRRNPRHFLAPMAGRKLAEIEESSGNLDAACALYRELTDVDIAEFPREVAYLDLGRCLEEQGDRSGAVGAYQTVLDDFPESIYAADARRLKQELEGG